MFELNSSINARRTRTTFFLLFYSTQMDARKGFQDFTASLMRVKSFCSQFVQPTDLDTFPMSESFTTTMKQLTKLVNLNLDNDIMQLERRVFMKRSLSKLMVKPQSIGCRINSALISVKHYKERLYRRRNVLSKAAKRYLEASYSIGCYPNKIERERIAKSCNLSPQQVRVWFGNRRYRDKSRKDAMKFIQVHSKD